MTGGELLSPMLLHQHSLMNSQGGSRIGGTPSIMAPVIPHNALRNSEKQDLLMKAPYSEYFQVFVVMTIRVTS